MSSGNDRSWGGSAPSLFDGGTTVGMDDEQLLERFVATRQEVAFEALIARHGPMVLGVCRGAVGDEQDAQDAFQATFLVLARRAGSIRRRESLASWLYGVARKVAARARADAARRRAREQVAAARPRTAASPGMDGEDLAALHEEIDRLPGKYRQPVILCYLDGMTYEDAARHLDCPLGTLSIRLKRARERLRSSLTRRGVALPVGLIGVALIPTPAPAAVPAGLATLTLRTALISISSKAMVGGTVPPAVAALAARMTTMMRLKMIAVGLLIGGGFAVAAAGSLAMQPTPPQQSPPAVASMPPEPRSFIVRFSDGTIVELVGISTYPSKPDSWQTPDGTPLAKAPYYRAGYGVSAGDKDQVWEVAFRMQTINKKERFKLHTGLPTDFKGPIGNPGFDAMRLQVPGIYSYPLILPQDRMSCPVRCGLATGTWKTEFATDGSEMRDDGTAATRVVIGTAGQSEGKTFITVSEENSADDSRVMAVDSLGIEHEPSQYRCCGVGRFVQNELEYNLPLAGIKEFRYQMRTYEWATAGDVILKPRKNQDATAVPVNK